MSDYFGRDPTRFDIEDDGDGKPGIVQFGNALQVWSVMQERPTSVAEAAVAFNCEPLMIIEAVNDHNWMLLTGPDDDFTKLMIEHDGE